MFFWRTMVSGSIPWPRFNVPPSFGSFKYPLRVLSDRIYSVHVDLAALREVIFTGGPGGARGQKQAGGIRLGWSRLPTSHALRDVKHPHNLLPPDPTIKANAEEKSSYAHHYDEGLRRTHPSISSRGNYLAWS